MGVVSLEAAGEGGFIDLLGLIDFARRRAVPVFSSAS
jgi:hypothetical protein